MFYGNMSSVGPVEALVSLVMRFVPSIAKIASESRHSEASKAILSLQWIFLPVYVGGLLYLQPPWRGSARFSVRERLGPLPTNSKFPVVVGACLKFFF